MSLNACIIYRLGLTSTVQEGGEKKREIDGNIHLVDMAGRMKGSLRKDRL